MTKEKRIAYGGLILLVLALMRIYVSTRHNTSDFEIFYSDTQDLSSAYTPKIERKIQHIESLPQLSFHFNKEPAQIEETDRNPFVFGLDLRKQAEAKQRFEAVEEKVEEIQEELVPEEPQGPKAPDFDGEVLGVMEDLGRNRKQVSIRFDDEIFVLEEGQVFRKEFRVTAISYEKIVIQKKGFELPINIDISPEASASDY